MTVNGYRIIVIGGSAGSFQIVSSILQGLPDEFSIPLVLCLHRLKHVRNGFSEALSLRSKLKIVEPCDKEPIRKGLVYLAPANYHLSIEVSQTFSLSTEDNINFSRPSLDVTFDTASYVFRERMLGVLLSGANADGADGICNARKRGSRILLQNPDEAEVSTMPLATLKKNPDLQVLSTMDIINTIAVLGT